MRLPLYHRKKFATIICASALTMTNTDETKDKFFEYVISAVPVADKLVIRSDFNARIGQDSASWEGVLGKHGTEKCSTNGLLLLQTCSKHYFLITNTVFRFPTRNKTSWVHPRSKHWHLIVYAIVKRRNRRDVRVTRVVYDAERWTDHRQIISKLSIRSLPKTSPQGKKAAKRLNVTKLKDVPTKQLFGETLDDRLNTILLGKQGLEAAWYIAKAIKCLGPSTRRHRHHRPHREKARCPPGTLSWSLVYGQIRRSKEHPQRCSAQAAWKARFLTER